MIKSAKLLIFSLLVSSIPSLHAMQNADNLSVISYKNQKKSEKIDFNKERMKQLISKYQFDDELKCLAQLLLLNRSELEKTLDAEKKSYQTTLQINNKPHKNNNLKKIILILEALYLTATTEKQLKNNNKLYRFLGLLFHPDKTKDMNNKMQQQAQDCLINSEVLLRSNQNNSHLDEMIQSIHKKRHERVEQINNPSALACAAHFFCSTTLPMIGQGLGAVMYHKTFAQIMPRAENENTPNENILYNICVANARRTGLDIETKLVKIPFRP